LRTFKVLYSLIGGFYCCYVFCLFSNLSFLMTVWLMLSYAFKDIFKVSSVVRRRSIKKGVMTINQSKGCIIVNTAFQLKLLINNDNKINKKLFYLSSKIIHRIHCLFHSSFYNKINICHISIIYYVTAIDNGLFSLEIIYMIWWI
jgi:hypothetical protein